MKLAGSLDKSVQFWNVMESYLRASEDNCLLFEQNHGLNFLTLSLRSHQSCESNNSIVQIIGHIASIPALTDAIRRSEITDYLRLVANTPFHEDKVVS